MTSNILSCSKSFVGLMLLLIFAVSCSENSVAPKSGDDFITANISGDYNFIFKSDNIYFKKYESNEIIISTENLINPNEIFRIQLKIYYQDGLTKFNLSNNEKQTSFEKRNLINTTSIYNLNVEGQIQFDYFAEDSIGGTFNFSAIKNDSVPSADRQINVTNATFKIKNSK